MTAPLTAPDGRRWEDWSESERIVYAMRGLTGTYGFGANAAAGIVGNLFAESAVLPNRIEGSKRETPMTAKDFTDVARPWTPVEVMKRDKNAKLGPKKPGIGLAQWTSEGRRAGLFAHTFGGVVLGDAILGSMDAQLDYLVAELQKGYKAVYNKLVSPGVSVDAASDELVYNFEVPGSVLYKGADGKSKKYPRTAPEVQPTFEKRRRYSLKALAEHQANINER